MESLWNLQLKNAGKLLNTLEHPFESELFMLALQEFYNIHRFESVIGIPIDQLYNATNYFAFGFIGRTSWTARNCACQIRIDPNFYLAIFTYTDLIFVDHQLSIISVSLPKPHEGLSKDIEVLGKGDVVQFSQSQRHVLYVHFYGVGLSAQGSFYFAVNEQNRHKLRALFSPVKMLHQTFQFLLVILQLIFLNKQIMVDVLVNIIRLVVLSRVKSGDRGRSSKDASDPVEMVRVERGCSVTLSFCAIANI